MPKTLSCCALYLDAAASAKVAAVTAVLITIQFSGSTSEDVQAQVLLPLFWGKS